VTVADLLARLERVKKNGSGWTARCPAHDDRNPSLSICEGEDGRILLKCHANCTVEVILAALGLEKADLFDRRDDWRLPPPRPRSSASTEQPGPARELRADERAYEYCDESGELLFRAVRTPTASGKTFRLESWDGSRWLTGLNGSRLVVYRLPEVVAAVAAGETVFIVEGEKCADWLARLDFCSACNPMGAGKPLDAYRDSFRGARVVVIADCDDAGRKHAHAWVEALAGVAAEVRLAELDPTRDDTYDVVDLLAERWRETRDRDVLRDEVEALVRRSVTVPRPRTTSRSDDRRGVVQRSAVSSQVSSQLLSAPTQTQSQSQKSYSDQPNPRAGGSEKKPFARSLEEALAGSVEETAWVWTGYVPRQAVVAFAGLPKVGKTTTLFGLIAAVVDGSEFAGIPTTATGVLLLSEERPPTLREKMERFGLDGRVHLTMRHEVAGMPWPEIVASAVAYAMQHGLGLIVVDTIDKWWGLRGDQENSSGAVLEAFQPLAFAAADGLAVLLSTHQRKSGGEHGEAVRGSNALTGAVDVILELERGKGDLDAQRTRVLKATSRFESTREKLVLRLDDDRFVGDDAAAAEERAQRVRVLDALSDDPVEKAAVAQAARISTATAGRRLSEFHAEGLAEREGTGRKGDPYRYRRAQSSEATDAVPAETRRPASENGNPGDFSNGRPDHLDFDALVGHPPKGCEE
jgi:hypothetical protein